jgi:hypothetical protein
VPFIAVHLLFSQVADTMKQFGLLPFHVVQNPSLRASCSPPAGERRQH